MVAVRWHSGRHHARPLIVVVVGALLILADCVSSSTTWPLAGWTVYHDSHYSFALPIPPGWHVSSRTDTLSTGPICDYVAGVFPPDVKVDETQKMADFTEQVFVRVAVGCDTWPAYGHLGPFTVEPKSIVISDAQATMYDSNPDGGWLQRTATAQFGGHEYIFGLQSPPEHAQRDLMAYTQMLQGFRYSD